MGTSNIGNTKVLGQQRCCVVVYGMMNDKITHSCHDLAYSNIFAIWYAKKQSHQNVSSHKVMLLTSKMMNFGMEKGKIWCIVGSGGTSIILEGRRGQGKIFGVKKIFLNSPEACNNYHCLCWNCQIWSNSTHLIMGGGGECPCGATTNCGKEKSPLSVFFLHTMHHFGDQLFTLWMTFQIVRHDRTMEQIVFPILPVCEFLTAMTKYKVYHTAEQDEQGSKVSDFFERTEDMFEEMQWQKKLRGNYRQGNSKS